ncbi:MAG: hypothetical protein WCR49_02360 [Opitutae bacterium]
MRSGFNIAGDKLMFAGAAVIFALGCVWAANGQREIRRLRHVPVAISLTGPTYQPTQLPRPDTAKGAWISPGETFSGPGGIGGLFTPPGVYHDTSASPDCRLLAVKPEPFRLQLVGYVGVPGDYRAAFVRPGHPGTLLAREGHCFADLELTLTKFTVNTVSRTPGLAASPVHAISSQAVLADHQTGDEVVLEGGLLRCTATPLAVLQSADDNQPRELREGDDYQAGDATYRVERIQLAPPLVVIARQGLDSTLQERKTLHPPLPLSRKGRMARDTDIVPAGGVSAAGLAANSN